MSDLIAGRQLCCCSMVANIFSLFADWELWRFDMIDFFVDLVRVVPSGLFIFCLRGFLEELLIGSSFSLAESIIVVGLAALAGELSSSVTLPAYHTNVHFINEQLFCSQHPLTTLLLLTRVNCFHSLKCDWALNE